MRSFPAAVVVLAAALALVGPAHAETTFGVSDDTGKYAVDGGGRFFSNLRSAGLGANRVTILWDASRPTTIVDRPFLDRSLPGALARGVRITFAVYPSRGDALASSPNGPAEFAEFLRLLARTYPQVKDYVIGNEPNKAQFWRPQFAPDGKPVAAATFEPVLAAAYDALKGVDPSIRVAAVGVSERGNDNPSAESNVSTSPIRFLRDLGAAYRASGRTTPIMDELSIHPYPESPNDGLDKHYAWPSAGFANVDRVKQALWDAFDGTGQPTVEQGLRLRVGEIGWQVRIVSEHAGSYTGTETVPATDEATQASVYGDLVRRAGCDPAISSVYLFGLVDEPQLDRFQAALLRTDYSERPAYHAVRRALAETGGGCAGEARTWQHRLDVEGAAATFGDLRRPSSPKRQAWSFTVTAEEEAGYRAGIIRVGAAPAGRTAIARALQGTALAARAAGLVKARWTPRVTFPKRRLAPGRYVYAVELAATMNPARKSVFVSKPFRVASK